MEFKGNQGKLHVEFIDEDHFVSISNEKGQSVASISTREDTYEEAKAYGVLFSKAPEMLDMLQQIIKEYDLDIVKGIDANKLRELIKEATEL